LRRPSDLRSACSPRGGLRGAFCRAGTEQPCSSTAPTFVVICFDNGLTGGRRGVALTPMETRSDVILQAGGTCRRTRLRDLFGCRGWGFDCSMVLAEIVLRTRHIRLVLGVFSLSGRTPATLAMTAAMCPRAVARTRGTVEYGQATIRGPGTLVASTLPASRQRAEDRTGEILTASVTGIDRGVRPRSASEDVKLVTVASTGSVERARIRLCLSWGQHGFVRSAGSHVPTGTGCRHAW
jgi:hypothetical protein